MTDLHTTSGGRSVDTDEEEDHDLFSPADAAFWSFLACIGAGLLVALLVLALINIFLLA